MSLYHTATNMNFTLPFEIVGSSGEYEARSCTGIYVPKKSKIKKIVLNDASWYVSSAPSSYYFKIYFREIQKRTGVYNQKSNQLAYITKKPAEITEETPVEFILSDYSSLSDDYPYIGISVESCDRTFSYGISIRGYLQF